MTARPHGLLPLCLLAASLGLSACSSSMDTLDQQPANTETFLQITAAGAGPLNATVAYDSKTITGLMPGYSTGSVLIGLEAATTNATVLFRKLYGGQVQVLHILPGDHGMIGQIHGVTHHVVGPAGERPGMTLKQAGVDPASCRAGAELWLGMAICKSRGAANVTLTFSFKGESAMASDLPPTAELETGELQRIIWTPPT